MEIIIIGRGGQGAVKAAQLLATSAFLSGYEAQAFPMFGVERRGAPVSSFVRISDKPIKTRAQIERADYAVILDATLLNSRKIDARTIILNSSKLPAKCRGIDADAIASKIFPKGINTVMIAAFAFLTGIIEKDALLNACKEIFEGEMANKNIQIVEETFSSLVKLRKK
ncbi:2-oxoacid:acceptor oxidoreductase family protein [Candidatus Pacearchaeota archaeon]|nr:2-oxoacid:acceptor oxidoreductase family protein [Candidatus Pacearchaeota archaeon]